MHNRSGRAIPAVFALLLVSLGGCASIEDVEPATTSSVLQEQVPGVAVATEPNGKLTPPPTPASLAAFSYLRTAKGHAAKGQGEQTLRAQRVWNEADRTLVVREVIGEGDDTPPPFTGTPATGTPKQGSDFFFTLSPSGDLLLVRSTDFVDRVMTEFVPPMLVMPAKPVVGASFSSDFEMIVHPIDHPDTIKTRGQASNKGTIDGVERIRVPAGEFLTLRISSTLRAKLGPADVRSDSTTWYAPGKGVVLERESEQVVALGFRVRSSKVTWSSEKLEMSK